MRPNPIREAVRMVVTVAILAVALVVTIWGCAETLAHPSCWLTH